MSEANEAAAGSNLMQQLAQERLARQKQASKKRERDQSVSPPPLSRKAPKLESSPVSLPSGARLTSFASVVNDTQLARKSENANAANSRLKHANRLPTPAATQSTPASTPSQQGSIQYPNGVVKKTWAYRHPRTGRDIKLEEVLEPQTLRTAVLSAFQWNTDWVLSKLKVPPNGGTTKCVFVMQAKEDELKAEMLEQTKDNRSWLRLCFPPMIGQTFCMHSKLMLLFHPDKLRIVVPTANLLDFDWGETGLMENSVWLVDLPRLPNEKKVAAEDLTSFGKELLYFLDKKGLDADVKDGILSFDFAATADIAFVHTVGNVSFGAQAKRTGLPGLAQAVRDLGLTTTNLEIDFAASSIGSLNDAFLRTVHSAATGEDIIATADAALTKAKTTFFTPKTATSSAPQALNIRDQIRIYFPTKETVQDSTAGAAGTICLSRKWFEGPNFPRQIFRDYISTRPGLLSHNKILYARGSRQHPKTSAMKKLAWAYVGSSNMSESAWGKLVYDKKDKAWRINCRNWECGVLLPVPAKLTEADKGEGLVDMNVFDGFVEPPFLVPGVEYDGRREPWYFTEKH